MLPAFPIPLAVAPIAIEAMRAELANPIPDIVPADPIPFNDDDPTVFAASHIPDTPYFKPLAIFAIFVPTFSGLFIISAAGGEVCFFWFHQLERAFLTLTVSMIAILFFQDLHLNPLKYMETAAAVGRQSSILYGKSGTCDNA